jgi:hypothetical protein
MNQKSSVIQILKSAQRVLTSDSHIQKLATVYIGAVAHHDIYVVQFWREIAFIFVH